MNLLPPAAAFPITHGPILNFSEPYPTSIYGLRDKALRIESASVSTAFGFNAGPSDLVLSRPNGTDLRVLPNWYFSVPFSRWLDVDTRGGSLGTSLLIVRENYCGVAMVGGPVESVGRLRYIDGCSDSVLIHPPVLGDPVYNLLHFPAGITQTPHTHPTIRAGIIHSGSGVCITDNGEFPLEAGKGFILWPEAVHSFNTRESDMTLTVFHPDSDCGPSHNDHPMLNRTIVDGVSAKHIDKIRTQA